jgi:uncharacterized membrane protein YhaH (DUF805 family)
MVNFIDAIKLGFKNWLNFSGRATRAEYWWFYLFVLIVGIVTINIEPIIGSIFYLIILVPHLSLSFRRLHDINKTAWWLLIGLIPLVGALVLIYFLATKGTEGPNKFGAPRTFTVQEKSDSVIR